MFAEFEECGFELGGSVDVFGDVEGVEAGIDRFVAEEGEGLAKFGSIAEGLEAGEVEAEGINCISWGKLAGKIKELLIELLNLGSETNSGSFSRLRMNGRVAIPCFINCG